MEKYSVHFEIGNGRETKTGVTIPENYDFLVPLMTYFIKKCTFFRIESREDENEAILKEQEFSDRLLIQIWII
ncbi:MAG: hypothetical protein PWQ59_2099 [Thermoanaerobacterium sp.]|jgi:hypothetical protein|nr:hypothetical protein [Thermoanaerobacterium sp.]